MRKTAFSYCFMLLMALCGPLFNACNTGIESTRAIKMSRSDKRVTRPGEEQLFIDSLRSEPLSEWRLGKPFLIADNKAAVILEMPSSISADPEVAAIEGRLVKYAGTSVRNTPGGTSVAIIEFSDSTDTFRYDTGRSLDDAKLLTALDIPMMIDVDLVNEADKLMKGRTLWTLSRLWYDADGNSIDGKKYVPVQVSGVVSGTMLFPLRVMFTDAGGRKASMLVNITSRTGIGAESRTFPTLFSLTDPKLRYPAITDEFWTLICDGKVALGMTKDECRLALGSPSETDSGHNWDYLVDVWSYNDGTYLQFKDGLLVGFRK